MKKIIQMVFPLAIYKIPVTVYLFPGFQPHSPTNAKFILLTGIVWSMENIDMARTLTSQTSSNKSQSLGLGHISRASGSFSLDTVSNAHCVLWSLCFPAFQRITSSIKHFMSGGPEFVVALQGRLHFTNITEMFKRMEVNRSCRETACPIIYLHWISTRSSIWLDFCHLIFPTSTGLF